MWMSFCLGIDSIWSLSKVVVDQLQPVRGFSRQEALEGLGMLRKALETSVPIGPTPSCET